MENNNQQNGHNGLNRILAFVNRVDPFEFEFDGLRVSGHWWKYKTTTPGYKNDRDKALSALQERADAIPKPIEKEEDLPQSIKAIKDSGKRAAAWAKLNEEREVERTRLNKELETDLNNYALSFFTDTIKEWKDEDGNEIPLTLEVFQQIPEPFTQGLSKHFKELREQAVNPTKSPNSPSG